jgi:hypothetical protein
MAPRRPGDPPLLVGAADHARAARMGANTLGIGRADCRCVELDAKSGGLIMRIVFEHSGIVVCLIFEDVNNRFGRKAFRLDGCLPCSLLGRFWHFVVFGSAKVRTLLSILPAAFSRPIRLSH